MVMFKSYTLVDLPLPPCDVLKINKATLDFSHSIDSTVCAQRALTWATAIHLSMTLALCVGLLREQRGELPGDTGGWHSSEVITRLVTALNWAMVARTVGAMSRFSFLSRWDQTHPTQWNGTTFTKRS